MPGLESKGMLGIQNVKMGEIEAVGLPEGESFQSITGVGFKPKVVFFFSFGTGGTYQIASYGFDDGNSARCTILCGDSIDVDGAPASSISIRRTSVVFLEGHITSMDNDGFTIRWYVSGGMEGMVYYHAMK